MISWVAWLCLGIAAFNIPLGLHGWLHGRKWCLKAEEKQGLELLRLAPFVAAIGLLLLWLPHMFEAGSCERAAERFAKAWSCGNTGAMLANMDEHAKYPDLVERPLPAPLKVALAYDDMLWVRSWEEGAVKARVYTGMVVLVDTAFSGKETSFEADVALWVAKDTCKVCGVYVTRR